MKLDDSEDVNESKYEFREGPTGVSARHTGGDACLPVGDVSKAASGRLKLKRVPSLPRHTCSIEQ